MQTEIWCLSATGSTTGIGWVMRTGIGCGSQQVAPQLHTWPKGSGYIDRSIWRATSASQQKASKSCTDWSSCALSSRLWRYVSKILSIRIKSLTEINSGDLAVGSVLGRTSWVGPVPHGNKSRHLSDLSISKSARWDKNINAKHQRGLLHYTNKTGMWLARAHQSCLLRTSNLISSIIT